MNLYRVTLMAFLGSILWSVHFLLIYVMAEFGCVSQLAWTTKAIMISSTILVFAGLFSIYCIWKIKISCNKDNFPSTYFLASYGILNNAIFTFIMVYQSIPVFYFQGDCH